jgi:hypothetical protein
LAKEKEQDFESRGSGFLARGYTGPTGLGYAHLWIHETRATRGYSVHMDANQGSVRFSICLGECSTPGIVLLVIGNLENDHGTRWNLFRELRVLKKVLVEFPNEDPVALLKGLDHRSSPEEKIPTSPQTNDASHLLA